MATNRKKSVLNYVMGVLSIGTKQFQFCLFSKQSHLLKASLLPSSSSTLEILKADKHSLSHRSAGTWPTSSSPGLFHNCEDWSWCLQDFLWDHVVGATNGPIYMFLMSEEIVVDLGLITNFWPQVKSLNPKSINTFECSTSKYMKHN